MSGIQTVCDCHACELGDPAMCYGCPVHGAWCDWFGEGPKCAALGEFHQQGECGGDCSGCCNETELNS